MVASVGIAVDTGRNQSVGQAAADEAVVDADVVVQMLPRWMGEECGAITTVAWNAANRVRASSVIPCVPLGCARHR